MSVISACLQDFDKQPHWQLIKEMLTHLFATPKNHPRSKPFVDHIINFSIADNRLWIRNYQVPPASYPLKPCHFYKKLNTSMRTPLLSLSISLDFCLDCVGRTIAIFPWCFVQRPHISIFKLAHIMTIHSQISLKKSFNSSLQNLKEKLSAKPAADNHESPAKCNHLGWLLEIEFPPFFDRLWHFQTRRRSLQKVCPLLRQGLEQL